MAIERCLEPELQHAWRWKEKTVEYFEAEEDEKHGVARKG